MQDDFRSRNPKTVWQNQPREGKTMTLAEIRQKAQKLQKKTQWQLFGNVALMAITAVLCGIGVMRTHAPAPRLVFALAFAWIFIGQYFFHRGMWSSTISDRVGLSSGLEFYRAEIERRQFLFLRVLQWLFGPVVLAIGTFIWVMAGIARSQNRSLNAMMPFSILFVIWIVAFFIQKSRGQKELQREAEELKQIDQEIC